MSVVHIIEGPYYRGYFYKECMGIFQGPSELYVLERCPYYRGVRKERFDCTFVSLLCVT